MLATRFGKGNGKLEEVKCELRGCRVAVVRPSGDLMLLAPQSPEDATALCSELLSAAVGSLPVSKMDDTLEALLVLRAQINQYISIAEIAKRV